MKSTKLGTRALAGLVAILINVLILGGIDRLAVGHGVAADWSSSAMAKDHSATGKVAI